MAFVTAYDAACNRVGNAGADVLQMLSVVVEHADEVRFVIAHVELVPIVDAHAGRETQMIAKIALTPDATRGGIVDMNCRQRENDVSSIVSSRRWWWLDETPCALTGEKRFSQCLPHSLTFSQSGKHAARHDSFRIASSSSSLPFIIFDSMTMMRPC